MFLAIQTCANVFRFACISELCEYFPIFFLGNLRLDANSTILLHASDKIKTKSNMIHIAKQMRNKQTN